MRVGNIEVYGVIYKIRNKVNNKVYIGQTTRGFNGRYQAKGFGIERVYNYHLYYKNRGDRYNRYLLGSIEKHGFNSFEVSEVIDVAFTKTELDIKERCYVKIYNSFNNGYNNTLGGQDGCINKGENVHTSIYTTNQILKAKQMLANNINITDKEIEQETGICTNSMYGIKNLITWKEIGEQYNNDIERNVNILRHRRTFDLLDNEDMLFANFYEKGISPLETCKTLGLVDSGCDDKSGNIRFKEVRKLFHTFRLREQNLTRICDVCGKEFWINKTQRSKKYCNSCKKEAYKVREKKYREKLKNI